MMMMTDNSKQKTLLRFGAFYIASIGLLALIFAAVWPHTVSQVAAAPESHAAVSSQPVVLNEDAFLHERLESLQNYDEAFARMLASRTSPGSKDSANKKIIEEEQRFKISLDSIDRLNASRNDKFSVGRQDSLIASFRALLSNRRSIANLREAVSSQVTDMKPDQQNLLQLNNELQLKDDQIIALESKLRNATQTVVTTSPAKTSTVEPAGSDAQAKEQQISTLSESLAATRKQNESLNAQLTLIKRTASANSDAMDDLNGRNATLKKESSELNAELKLAQVDCNLSRANIREIISNSRQRKELLSQSLNILNDLAQSDNSIIQKKAKDKILQLKSVASMIHD